MPKAKTSRERGRKWHTQSRVHLPSDRKRDGWEPFRQTRSSTPPPTSQPGRSLWLAAEPEAEVRPSLSCCSSLCCCINSCRGGLLQMTRLPTSEFYFTLSETRHPLYPSPPCEPRKRIRENPSSISQVCSSA